MSAQIPADLHRDNRDVAALRGLLGVARRQWPLVALCLLAGLLAGGAAALMQPSVYRSAATIMVRSGPAIHGEASRPVTITPEEEGLFLSQLEVIRSALLAADVAGRLDLANDKAFAARPQSGLKLLGIRLARLAGIPVADDKPAASESPADQAAVVARLRANLSVSRQGRTYVASIAYQDGDPALAARIAQAWAEAFRDRLAADHKAATATIRSEYERQLAELDTAIAARRAGLPAVADPAYAEANMALFNLSNEKNRLQAEFSTAMAGQALPSMDAVILTDAARPEAPVSPRKGFMLVVGAIAGAGIGAVLAGLRNMADRGLHTGRDVEGAGYRFLGHVGKRAGRQKSSRPVASRPVRLEGVARLAIDEPNSDLAHTLGAIQVAAHRGDMRVIGITSPGGGEGKSLLAANLAAWLAAQGRRVVLVDGDWHQAALSKWIAPQADKGILDMILAGVPLAEAETTDPATSLSVLARGAGGKVVEPTGLMLSDAAQKVMDQIRPGQDVIVIDLPALGRPEAQAARHLVDGYVVVARWGRTQAVQLADSVARAGIGDKVLGVVLNRTPMRKLALYED